MSFFKKLFGGGSDKIREMLAAGAVVIDVRSPEEFQSGHVQGAKNIPLPEIKSRKKEIIKLGKPVVFCCASGMRSGNATRIMKSEGLNCENGGGWASVNNLLST